MLMLKLFKRYNLTILCILLLQSETLLAQDPRQPSIAKVTKLTKKAEVLRSDQAKQRLALGVDLYSKDVVRTKRQAQLNIKLEGGSNLELDENSRLELNNYVVDAPPSASLYLTRGRLTAWITSPFENQQARLFQIRTDKAIVNVRSTHFAVHARAQSSRIIVYRGVVEVRHSNPSIPFHRIVRAGESLTIDESTTSSEFNSGSYSVFICPLHSAPTFRTRTKESWASPHRSNASTINHP